MLGKDNTDKMASQNKMERKFSSNPTEEGAKAKEGAV